MLSFRVFSALLALSVLTFLSACTVEPLNAARSNSQLVNGNYNASVSQTLAATEIDPVSERSAQQVRNRLLFAMNGGELQPGGRYRVSLTVKETTQTLSVQASSLAPTSAQVRVLADYSLIDKKSGGVIATGQRRALAAYDRTPQSFSNLRAQRDAQDRAAREVAEQLRLAIAQNIARL